MSPNAAPDNRWKQKFLRTLPTNILKTIKKNVPEVCRLQESTARAVLDDSGYA
jgi:hypothetical protein